MMHVNPATLSALSPAKAKAEALKTFEEACNNPAFDDWRGLSMLMHAALSAKPKRKSADDNTPEWWSCYQFGKKAERVSIEVQFSDGRTVRASVNSDPGKPFNIGRGLKVALEFYRQRIFKAAGCPEVVRLYTVRLGYTEPYGAVDRTHAGASHVAVPEIVSVARLDTGEAFDAAECSRLTAEWRAGSWTLEEAQARAEAVPAPDLYLSDDYEGARRKWTAYQLELDYARAWLEHAKPAGGWCATMEESRAIHEAPRCAVAAEAEDCPLVEECEAVGESMLAEEAATEGLTEAQNETLERLIPPARSPSILSKLSRSLTASVHPWPVLPVRSPIGPMQFAY